jgi:hypothetical protein
MRGHRPRKVRPDGAMPGCYGTAHGCQRLRYFPTCAEAPVGFGWLDRLTKSVLKAWRENPQLSPEGAEWRFVVLHKGQMVHFPAGTVHFVVRHATPHSCTLIFGGHIIRRSQIASWADLCLQQLYYPDSVNEDEWECLKPYLIWMGLYVKRARAADKLDIWGGESAVAVFWETMQVRRSNNVPHNDRIA